MFISLKHIRLSLRKYLILLSLVVAVPLLIIINFLLYSQTRDFLLNKMELINQTKLGQISSDIDDNLTQIAKVINYLNTNKQLISYITEAEDPAADSLKKNTAFQSLNKLLSSINENNELIWSINVFSKKSRYDSNDRIIADDEVLRGLSEKSPQRSRRREAAGGTGSGAVSDNAGSYLLDYSNKNVYFMSDISDGAKIYGKVAILLKEDFLKDRISDMENAALLDGEGGTIWKGEAFDYPDIGNLGKEHMTASKPVRVFSDREKKLYVKKVAFNEWTIAYLYDMNSFEALLLLLRNLVLLVFGLSVLLACLFSNLFSQKIFRPIEELTRLTKAYGKGSEQLVRYRNGRSRKVPLINKIFYYLTISILLPIAFNLAAFHLQSQKVIEEQVSNAYDAMFTAAANKIDNFIEKKKSVLKNIAFNAAIQKYIDLDRVNHPELEYQINEIIEKNTYLGLERDNLRILTEDNRLILSSQWSQSQKMSSAFHKVMEVSNKGVKWNVEQDKLNRYVVSLGLAVPNDTYSRMIGYASVDIDNIYIAEQYMQLKADNCKVFIFDAGGNIISHSDIDKIGGQHDYAMYTGESEGKGPVKVEGGTLFFHKKLKSMPWYFACTYDYNDLLKQTRVLLTSNIYLYVITFILIIVISSIFSGFLLRPINRLNGAFHNTNLENMHNKLEVGSSIDEIETLGKTFNAMMERIEELFDELIMANMKKQELENGKREAELIALQAQINPHFLYNTLDSINYQIKEDKREGAVRMVDALSNLFRVGISREEIVIDIKDEIEYAKSYIDIMTMRHGNKISVGWNYDSRLLNYKTIKLILQPIIENAIYHGIRKKGGAGSIEITGFECEDGIKFEIRDDGAGIPYNELRTIKENLMSGRNKNKVGIFNVHSRIQLYYGEKYGLDIVSPEGGGTKVTVYIPKNITTES